MDKRTLKQLVKHSHIGNGNYKSANISYARRPVIEEGDEIIVLKKKKEEPSCLMYLIGFIVLAIVIYQSAKNHYSNTSTKDNQVQRSESSYDSASDIAQPAKVEPEERIWTNRKDGREITGTYIEYKNGKATVLRDNGKTVTIPLELLSDEDREYIKSIRKQDK